MKIILLDNFPKDLNKPFAGYRYDEILAHMDGNINIREILAEKSDDWLLFLCLYYLLQLRNITLKNIVKRCTKENINLCVA